jgi:hypothetical protein
MAVGAFMDQPAEFDVGAMIATMAAVTITPLILLSLMYNNLLII